MWLYKLRDDWQLDSVDVAVSKRCLAVDERVAQVGVGGDNWASYRWANVCEPHHWRMCLGPASRRSHVSYLVTCLSTYVLFRSQKWGLYAMMLSFCFVCWSVDCFCCAMLCKHGLSRHAVSCLSVWCVSVRYVGSCQNGWQHHSSFSVPNGMGVFWWVPPNWRVECRWGRQKSRFWANIWLHCVTLTLLPARCYQYDDARPRSCKLWHLPLVD